MNIRNVVTWVLITVILFLGIYLVYWTRTESFQCLANPYTYSIKLLEKSNEAKISCLCSNVNRGSGSFVLDNQGFHTLYSGIIGNNLSSINLSGLGKD